MLVVVTIVGRVAVVIVDVINVIVVRHFVMSAGLTVDVVVVKVLDVRERVLVVMTIMAGMGMSFVDVVDVVVVVHGCVPAAGPVFVAVVGMYGVVGCGHGCSLEWVTASATMWAT